ncbi:DUF2835 domain-containing protein [Aestuariirhabdus sp. Z084]|uniref:DUF2835 domain-containing protein n=1 Tax=Aestuariirhabdus haliotis TaxID=2918751 RepID=UPI00201B398A|nr:DUF2835 domain-containing protein [Aestuariirhabdus haliotis]MCL6414621.1 DUF2835 domain-containing protein [Aestuariirhabdus haliotis]MCL6418397.1 DUF2835 domain-containing protein [Aestuariirhabdus haliotis]
MQSIRVDISISAQQYLAHYSGSVRNVQARSQDGRLIRFPSEILRPFVTRNGIEGCFCIEFDDEGRFQRISRV